MDLRTLTIVCGLLASGGCCYFRDSCSAAGNQGVWARRYAAPVRVWVDNRPAVWTGTGYRIAGNVSRTPDFRYMVDPASDFGEPEDLTIALYRECDGTWCDTPSFVLSASGADATNRTLRQKRTYRLGAPREGLFVANDLGHTMDRMTLEPNTRYLMKLDVSANRTEALRIELRTQ